jgi:hypothetical protein
LLSEKKGEIMTIKNSTFFSKAERDKIEQELRTKGFTEVSPFVKLKPHQFSLSRGTADPTKFEGLVTYTISWWIDE